MDTGNIDVVRVFLEKYNKNYEPKILFLKRASEQGKGKLCLPGGKKECDETLTEACIAELREETNLDISNLEQLYENVNGGYKTYYFKADYDGDLILNEESSDKFWLGYDEMDNYDIAFENDLFTKKYLESLFLDTNNYKNRLL